MAVFELGREPSSLKGEGKRSIYLTYHRLISSFSIRFFLLFLWLINFLWIIQSVCLSLLYLLAMLCSWRKRKIFREQSKKKGLALRRSIACAVALFLAFVNPSFGILVGCTYFLMYDKAGVEDVLPSSLQKQCRNLFKFRT